jgi:hypothetical protein
VNIPCDICEILPKSGGFAVRSKPDIMLVLAATFAFGVLATLLMPMSSRTSVAAPASPLQAGLIEPR